MTMNLATLLLANNPPKGADAARRQVALMPQTKDKAARIKTAQLAVQFGNYTDEGRAIWQEYLDKELAA